MDATLTQLHLFHITLHTDGPAVYSLYTHININTRRPHAEHIGPAYAPAGALKTRQPGCRMFRYDVGFTAEEK